MNNYKQQMFRWNFSYLYYV